MNRTPPVLAGAAVASVLFLAIARAVAAGSAASVPADAPKAPIPANLVSSGEVTKVDKTGGKLTIQHGPLRNLDMPGMTMAFKVGDPAMLERVKAGDKIEFVAENVGGALTVVRLDVTR
jgi:Cu/Ag efflux protein CusF